MISLFYNKMSSNDSIKVMCRFRPPNEFEKEKSTLIDVEIL